MIFGSDTISPLGPTKDVWSGIIPDVREGIPATCTLRAAECLDSGFFTGPQDEGRVEVEDDVDEEDDVDDAVDDQQRDVGHRL